jgi:acyl-CoA synthetase (AMP-forming)/AMP-acid ligase II
MACISKGAEVTVLRSYTPAEALHLMERDGITITHLVSTAYTSLVREVRDRQHGRVEPSLSLRKISVGAGALPQGWIDEAKFYLGIESALVPYGLTEASPVVTMTDAETLPGSDDNLLGWPVFYVETRVVDVEDGTSEVKLGKQGELTIRGPNVFLGYLNKPIETEQALKGGWLHTGDIVTQDSTGAFRFVGRIKDMIKSGGQNVYSAEVEAVIRQASGVDDVAVVGLPHQYWGEAVVAAVTVRPGGQFDEATVRQAAKAVLAGYKVPKMFIVVDQFPRTLTGKVQKAELVRALLDSGAYEKLQEL